MAREAGVYKDCAWRYEMKAEGDSLERFAALVIANHPPQSFMTYHEGVEAGRLAERERLQAFMRQMLDAYTLPSDPSGLKTRGTKE
jgi:hypothetical protein